MGLFDFLFGSDDESMNVEDYRSMSEELGMPEDCCLMGGCHVFWKHKKRILRTEYHMVWHSSLICSWCKRSLKA